MTMVMLHYTPAADQTDQLSQKLMQQQRQKLDQNQKKKTSNKKFTLNK